MNFDRGFVNTKVVVITFYIKIEEGEDDEYLKEVINNGIG
jgi:hypothetical protein